MFYNRLSLAFWDFQKIGELVRVASNFPNQRPHLKPGHTGFPARKKPVPDSIKET